ncbi:hypothetical protein BC828DRAFT_385785 [Blastocladiella britannica]|nr:hypothetical protein BC828DRAFT_385785 [Blastocladiella britannica]
MIQEQPSTRTSYKRPLADLDVPASGHYAAVTKRRVLQRPRLTEEKVPAVRFSHTDRYQLFLRELHTLLAAAGAQPRLALFAWIALVEISLQAVVAAADENPVDSRVLFEHPMRLISLVPLRSPLDPQLPLPELIARCTLPVLDPVQPLALHAVHAALIELRHILCYDLLAAREHVPYVDTCFASLVSMVIHFEDDLSFALAAVHVLDCTFFATETVHQPPFPEHDMVAIDAIKAAFASLQFGWTPASVGCLLPVVTASHPTTAAGVGAVQPASTQSILNVMYMFINMRHTERRVPLAQQSQFLQALGSMKQALAAQYHM